MESKALADRKQVCAAAKNSNVHQMEVTLNIHGIKYNRLFMRG